MSQTGSLGELGRRGQGLLHEDVKGDTGVFSREGCRFLKSVKSKFPRLSFLGCQSLICGEGGSEDFKFRKHWVR